jgi:hypothetical protein
VIRACTQNSKTGRYKFNLILYAIHNCVINIRGNIGILMISTKLEVQNLGPYELRHSYMMNVKFKDLLFVHFTSIMHIKRSIILYYNLFKTT